MSFNIVKKTLTYADFAAEATSATAVSYTTRQNETVLYQILVVDTDFAGGAVSACTASLGKSGAATKYMNATDVFTGAANGVANATVGTVHGVEPAGTELLVTLATTDADTDALTAGQLTVYTAVSAMG